MIIEEAANYYYKDGMEEKFAKKVFEPRSLQDFKNLYRYNMDISTKTNSAFVLFEKGKRNKVISVALSYIVDQEAHIDPIPYNL